MFSIGICLFFLNLLPYKENSKEKNIQMALEKGQQFLQNIQRSDGSIRDTLNPLFDVWETVLAVSTLYKIQPDTNHLFIKKALTFLRNNENTEGLICHNKKCKAAYCLETTALYFLLLNEIGEKDKVRNRLKMVLDMQKPSGEWLVGNPDVREQKDYPSVSAFILTLLQAVELKPLYSDEALIWIQNKQTADGNWGNVWEYYDCPAYALWPMMSALKNHNSPSMMAAKMKAIQYIKSNQNEPGNWDFKNSTRKKRPSSELQTALMLSALDNIGFNENEEIVSKAIDYLLEHQQTNGSWDGGYFPIDSERYEKKEYIFATSRAMSVLKSYLVHQNKGK